MAFDPDQYLQKIEGAGGGAFDPDAYLAKISPPEAAKAKTSAGDAAKDHFENAATLGYAPQIEGGLTKLALKVDDMIHGTKNSELVPYTKLRDDTTKNLDVESQEHPYASMAGTAGGAIGSAVAMSGLAPVKAASWYGRVAQAAKGGAMYGAASNPGDTEGQISGLQLHDRGFNALTGAAAGAVGQGAIEGITSGAKAVTGLAASMRNKAEERAFKASGAMLKDYRKVAGQDRVNELGRWMLDNGLVKAGSTYSDVAEGAEALAGKHGDAIGGILGKLDEAGAAAPAHADLAAKIEQQALPLKGMNTAKPTYNTLQDLADDIKTMGKADGPSFQSAQKVKSFISDQIDKTGGWGALNPTEKNLALRDAYHMVNGSIEDAAGAGAKELGDDALLKSYLGNKAGYRNALEVGKIAKDQALRQNANRFFSPTDYASGMGGAIIGAATGEDMEHKIKNAGIGLALGLANKGMRTYGTALVSQGLDKGGQLLAKTPLADMGKAAAPYLAAARRAPIGAAVADGIVSAPQLTRALPAVAQSDTDRSPAKGPEAWAQMGLVRLGIKDPGIQSRLLQDPKAQELLHRASNLAPGSRAMKQIMDQIQKGWGGQ